MTTTVRYCRGCNEEFAASDDDLRCPQCRQQMTACDITPTPELAETLVGESRKDGGASDDITSTLIGKRFASYTIEAFVGKGGMASVFRATHDTLRRPCAIKILSSELQSRNVEFVEQFISEARTAASVVHPHIVTVHNIGETDSSHYIELEYVAGQSLQHILQSEEKMPPLRATSFLQQACSGLAEAHRYGLIHRDFKPSNILVGPCDHAKLADFGLAKRVSSRRRSASDEPLTGTPYFMAPELFDGGEASKQADVYAVGVSFYHLYGRVSIR